MATSPPGWTEGLFRRIRPSFLEAWPDGLSALALPFRGVMLANGEIDALLSTPPLWRSHLTTNDPPPLHALAHRLAPLIAAHPDGAFIRLGSGSPKDAALFRETGGRVLGAVFAIKLLQTSPRMRRHMTWCAALGHPPRIFVRRWLDTSGGTEYRCFVRDGTLVGVAGPHPPEPPDHLSGFFRTVSTAAHMASGVYDVFCPGDTEARPLLLDLNPWGPPTDPAPFDWRRPRQFDGRFVHTPPPRSSGAGR